MYPLMFMQRVLPLTKGRIYDTNRRFCNSKSERTPYRKRNVPERIW